MNEKKELMKYYMNSILLPYPPEDCNRRHINKDAMELIIRKECNQQCEYCYIYKHGDELYPNKVTKKDILINVDLILDFVYNKRKNYFYNIELFAGDLFYDNIFFDIMDIFEKYFKQIKKEEPILFKKTTRIMVPTNLAFVYDNSDKCDKIIQYCENFAKYNIELCFSWSTDGPFGAETREKKDLPEDYFDKIFEFVGKIGAGLHPMTYAGNIKNAKKNYDWWLENIKKYFKDSNCDFQPMMLEVRNGNEWTEETINDYLDFLDYVLEKRYELCEYSIENMATHLFGSPEEVKERKALKKLNNYDVAMLPNPGNDLKNEGLPCALQSTIHFNCTNLSLSICHRLAYALFTPVYFKLNDEKTEIVDFDANNIDAYITTKNLKLQNMPVCMGCNYEPICLKGCLGAQFEYNGELLMPIPSVCNLFKKKYDHLIQKYNEYGIFECAKKIGVINEDTLNYYTKQLNRLGWDLDGSKN